jgi:hypothetical protein
MSKLVEKRKGYIDIYHGKHLDGGNSKGPVFEGQVKLDGKVLRFKCWRELGENFTKQERFSGYIFELEKEEDVLSQTDNKPKNGLPF